ncbi:MAG TPA: selenide, water dikinase SelD [Thermoanaerobaculia bacterium]|nr:selenide, water dikinase SelD [Thermoanaerobaculia bacterium]
MGQDDLRSVLAQLPSAEGLGDLLVGTSTNDDAAVLRIHRSAEGDTAIAQTVDFFTPIVDDPFTFGAIAAANSVSDIYAMGATPILGLAIAAFPTDKLPLETLHDILNGGASKAAEAGFPVAGGHTIIDDVPKYGLAVTGIVSVEKLVRNSTARPGDVLFLTKPIGNGIIISAHRAQTTRRFFRREGPNVDEAIDWMLRLNRDAARAMTEVGVSAATDVTGYGLVGHLLEMCVETGAELRVSQVPVLANARELLARGYLPAGSKRNVETFRKRVRSSVSEKELTFTLMCDAQTSGGLLIAVAPEKAEQLAARFEESGLFYAKVGAMTGEKGVVALVQ